MPYLYLFAAMACSAMLSVMSSLFSKHNPQCKSISFLYSAIVTGSAVCAWSIIWACSAEFDWRVIGYSLAYGVFYTMAMVGMFKAYQTGSVSMTAFVKQLSLIGVALWGFLFWNNTLTANIATGLVLIAGALYLCFMPGKEKEQKGLWTWWLYAAMLLVGNAGCSIVQKYQQMAFDGGFGNGFMLLGAVFSFAVCLLLYGKKGRGVAQAVKKRTLLYPVIGGASSAVLNLLILWLVSSPLSESIIFPGIAVGGLILTTMFSLLVYREKLRPHQWAGLSLGAVALVFLNI